MPIITAPGFDGRTHEIEVKNTNEVFDGYHTFGELYEHRARIFIALCKKIQDAHTDEEITPPVYRSKKHSDGSSYEGMFVLGIYGDRGSQITYHLEMEYWRDTHFATDLERAPEWDGHSPKDVLNRLKKI